ncbi:MAG: hemerythrin [Chloroflexi bacterium]|nr:hemerythrin [Chloroflexota bacterium]
MKATEILMEEHRVIERVLNSIELAAQRLSSGRTIPVEFFLIAADFIKGFADGCHHKKEEGVLFVALVAHGMSREAGPVAVMLAEHEEGRRLTRAMREGAERMQTGDQTAISQVTQNALGYVRLLRQHIQKENQILFPMADQMIPVEEHQQIAMAFDHVEHEETGAGIHEKYLGLAAVLEKAVMT